MTRTLELVKVVTRAHFLVKEDGAIVTEAASEVALYAGEVNGEMDGIIDKARSQIEAQLPEEGVR